MGKHRIKATDVSRTAKFRNCFVGEETLLEIGCFMTVIALCIGIIIISLAGIGTDTIVFIVFGVLSIIALIVWRFFKEYFYVELWNNGKKYKKVCRSLNRLTKSVREEHRQQRENYNERAEMLGLSNYIDSNYELHIDRDATITRLSIPSCVSFIRLDVNSAYSDTLEYVYVADRDVPLLVDFVGYVCNNGFNQFQGIKSKRKIMVDGNCGLDAKVYKALLEAGCM